MQAFNLAPILVTISHLPVFDFVDVVTVVATVVVVDDGDGDVHNAGMVSKPASEDEEDAAAEQGQGRESSRGERGEERKS